MKKAIFAIFLLINAQNLKAKSGFQIWGDIFAFLPAMAGAYTLTQKDYEGLARLALGTGLSMAITFGTKYTFVGISKVNKDAASISLRPDNSGYDGFPSGHTTSAFSAAGFIQKRYGWKWGMPITILAASVGASRVVADRHTITQVIAGAVLGYAMSYLLTTKLRERLYFEFDFHKQEIVYNHYQDVYSIGISYSF